MNEMTFREIVEMIKREVNRFPMINNMTEMQTCILTCATQIYMKQMEIEGRHYTDAPD